MPLFQNLPCLMQMYVPGVLMANLPSPLLISHVLCPVITYKHSTSTMDCHLKFSLFKEDINFVNSLVII